MKKLCTLLLALVLLVTLAAIPAAAAGTPAVKATNATGKPGATVEVTVTLSDFPTDTTSLSFTAEVPTAVTFLTQQSQWLLSGMISNIGGMYGGNDPEGVITGFQNVSSVNTQVLKLAFQLPQAADVNTYTVKVNISAQTASSDELIKANTNLTLTVSEPCTALSISQTSASLDMNGTKTVTLTATPTPAGTTDKVVWTTSDSSVATVENGVVTAKKAGTATITATCGAKTKTCKVTVTCSHSLVRTAASPATCQATGNNEYYTCSTCGIVLKANKTTETTVAAETLAKVAHKGGAATCTQQAVCQWCSQPYGSTLSHQYDTSKWEMDDTNHWRKCKTCTATTGTAKHTLQWVTDTPATQLANGSKHQECSCGYKTSLNTVIPHTHKATHHAAVASTCTKTGNVEYWTCASTLCSGKYYTNAQCTAETASVTTPINAQNHVETELRGKTAANCYQDGYTGDTHCKACNEKTATGTVIPATGNHVAGTAWSSDATNHWKTCTTAGCGAKVNEKAHAYTWVVDKAATEDDEGVKHEECTCGKKRSENTAIPKLDHVHKGIVRHKAVKATCVKAGTVEYWTCSSAKCDGKYYGDSKCQLELQTIVDPISTTNHVGGTELKDKLAPTCVATGYSGDTVCKSCKNVVKKGQVVAATGKHTPGKYEKDDKQHWRFCTVCQGLINNAKADHTMGWVIDRSPTESAAGSKHQACTACGYTDGKSTSIPKLVHAPELMAGTAATCDTDGTVAHYFCGNCFRYYAVTDGKLGSEIKKEDTVQKALGHSFAAEWLSDESGHWHACTTCSATSEVEAHQGQVIGAVEATEEAPGYTGDTLCSVCGFEMEKGQEVTLEKPEAPADTAGEGKKNDLTWLWVLLAALAVGVVLILVLKKKK